MNDLILHSGGAPNGFDAQSPQLDLTLRDLAVDGEWITGQAEINASAFGAALKGTQSFRTKNGDMVKLQVAGAALGLILGLKPTKQVCAQAELRWGMINLKATESCTDL